MTSVPWTHASPAGQVAHNVHRDNYEAIGVDMVNVNAADVIMGAGHPCYDNDGVPNGCTNPHNYVGGQATWDTLVAGTAGGDSDGDGIADPWTLIQTRAEFQALMSGPAPERVLGRRWSTKRCTNGGAATLMRIPTSCRAPKACRP